MLSVVFSTVFLLLRPTTTANSFALLKNTSTSSAAVRGGGGGTANSVINYSTTLGKSSTTKTTQTTTTTTAVMSSSRNNGGDSDVVGPTTNEEDQRKAAALQQRLKENNSVQAGSSSSVSVGGQVKPPLTPAVYIDPGRHKYVLISARYHKRPDLPSNDVDAWQRQFFVVSRKGAAYHRNAAEPFVALLEDHGGYQSIDITGGGRIHYDPTTKQIDVYGYSYGFGLADHALSKSIIENDPRFNKSTDYKVTWSNDGY